MQTISFLPFRLALLILGFGSLSGLSVAQLLTPGAAAIGGPTTDAPLIAPGGQTVQSNVVPITPVTEAEPARTVHLPDPNWEIILPPRRGGSGTPVSASISAPAATTQPSTSSSSSQTTVAATPSATPETTASTATMPANSKTQVTAGVSAAVPSSDSTVEPVVEAPAPVSANGLEQVALNFGADGVELTAQHEIALTPIVNQMRLNPLQPLRVAAVLALANSSDEEAKLRARRRILAVRRYLIEQGVNTENLSFVISANSATEPFANHVLIERADN